MWINTLLSSLGSSKEHRQLVYTAVLIGAGGTCAWYAWCGWNTKPANKDAPGKNSTNFDSFLKTQPASSERYVQQDHDDLIYGSLPRDILCLTFSEGTLC